MLAGKLKKAKVHIKKAQKNIKSIWQLCMPDNGERKWVY